jgi:MFS family permease
MAHAMGMFGLSSMTGRLVSRYGSRNVIRQGVAILAISSILAPISPEFMPLAVALFLLGLGWNFCFIAGSSLLSNALSPLEKGRVQGANEMLISISASVASISTGVAFGQGGILIVGIIGLIASIFLGLYSLVFSRTTKRETISRQSA